LNFKLSYTLIIAVFGGMKVAKILRVGRNLLKEEG